MKYFWLAGKKYSVVIILTSVFHHKAPYTDFQRLTNKHCIILAQLTFIVHTNQISLVGFFFSP